MQLCIPSIQRRSPAIALLLLGLIASPIGECAASSKKSAPKAPSLCPADYAKLNSVINTDSSKVLTELAEAEVRGLTHYTSIQNLPEILKGNALRTNAKDRGENVKAAGHGTPDVFMSLFTSASDGTDINRHISNYSSWNGSQNVVLVFKPKVLTRTDFHATEGYNYGSFDYHGRSMKFEKIGKFARIVRSSNDMTNEIVFKNDVPLDSFLDEIWVHPHNREYVDEALKKAKIDLKTMPHIRIVERTTFPGEEKIKEFGDDAVWIAKGMRPPPFTAESMAAEGLARLESSAADFRKMFKNMTRWGDVYSIRDRDLSSRVMKEGFAKIYDEMRRSPKLDTISNRSALRFAVEYTDFKYPDASAQVVMESLFRLAKYEGNDAIIPALTQGSRVGDRVILNETQMHPDDCREVLARMILMIDEKVLCGGKGNACPQLRKALISTIDRLAL